MRLVTGAHRIFIKIVPKLLSHEEQKLRLDVAQDMLECTQVDEDFLKTVITGDESWVYGYDPDTKAQSLQLKTPGSPRPKKARQVRSKVKVLLTVFLTAVVLCITTTQGQTVNEYYFHDAIQRKRPDFGN